MRETRTFKDEAGRGVQQRAERFARFRNFGILRIAARVPVRHATEVLANGPPLL